MRPAGKGDLRVFLKLPERTVMAGGDFVLSGGGRHCGNSVRLDIS